MSCIFTRWCSSKLTLVKDKEVDVGLLLSENDNVDTGTLGEEYVSLPGRHVTLSDWVGLCAVSHCSQLVTFSGYPSTAV